ncbi:hypothetical protein A2V49_01170 [candidate division WWE3 bacterium RBG_19FT_COMBO_34_6]|uniref:Uncharacterized protein n=1 Tax=candidate division WWE3 bacterium RBG_19FT_COMBO_34_6 TaxID=1802612 RepID=A0A1F4UJW4_UNCKA|nr:MAG: hypothetical protein A2V49_01170 [candidate division WWE3 bacterium RBG_19FT_COMBO_34_6]
MKSRKIIHKFNIFVLLSALFSKIVYGIDCSITTGDYGVANPSSMICPLYRIINFLIIAGGIVLAIMLGYGLIKFSIALGDPKGLEGGKKTITFAIIGFLVVIFAMALLGMIYRLLAGQGILTNIPSLQSMFETRFCEFLDMFWITGDPGCE